MSLSDLASVGNFLSGFAVLISLFYVILQIRQNTVNQRALIQQGRALVASEFLLRVADPSIAESYFKGSYGDDDITVLQLRQYLMIFRSRLFGWEDTFLQHNQKLLDKASFDSTVSAMRLILSQPGARTAWKQLRSSYAPTYVDFVDRIVRDVEVAQPIDELTRWKAAVAAERNGNPETV